MATPNVMQGSSFANHGDRTKLGKIAQLGGVRTEALPVENRRMKSAMVGAQSGLNMGSPLQRLASMPTDDKPITSGLSVGPGPGPESLGPDPKLMAALTYGQKLAALAQYAKTPHLRRMAASMLRALESNVSSGRV